MSVSVYPLPLFLAVIIFIVSFLPCLVARFHHQVFPHLKTPLATIDGVSLEAGLFTTLLNVTAVGCFIFGWIRHELLLRQFAGHPNWSPIIRLSQLSWLSISSMSLGLMIAANFRLPAPVAPHGVGVLFGLIVGSIDVAIQVKLATMTGKWKAATSRAGIYLLLVATIFGVFAFIFSSGLVKHPKHPDPDQLNWPSNRYSWYFEWIAFGLFSPYFLTFLSDFRGARLASQLVVVDEDDHLTIPVFDVEWIKSNIRSPA